MRIYISGAITGLNIEVAKGYFSEAQKQIEQMGHMALNPMELVPYRKDWAHLDPDEQWRRYMMLDIDILFNADAIFMLENWMMSKGAQIEHSIAAHCKKAFIIHSQWFLQYER